MYTQNQPSLEALADISLGMLAAVQRLPKQVSL